MSAVVDHVLHEDELEPVRDEGDTATTRVSFDSSNGCEHLEQRLIRFTPGRSRDRSVERRQEVLFVVSGMLRSRQATGTGEAASKPLKQGRKTTSEPVLAGDDDMAEIEALLRKRGIS